MLARNLIALGDSHLEALELAANMNLLAVGSSHFATVPGATVIGLRNPNSMTDAIGIFRSSLKTQSRDSYVLIHLGEVDCGFVMWWRAKKYGEDIRRQFRESIDAYRQFIAEVLGLGFDNGKLCITGASLPTIRDGAEFGEVANKRSEVDIDIRQRTELTLNYNDELVKLTKAFGAHYFDITDAVLDRSKNLVHDFFRNSNEADHHLDPQKVVGIWTAKCNAFLGDWSQL